MKHLCILIVFSLIHSNAFFSLYPQEYKYQKTGVFASTFKIPLDTNKTGEESLISIDTLVSLPPTELNLTKDTNATLQSEIPKMQVDTLSLIPQEITKTPVDSNFQSEPLLTPTDTGVMQTGKNVVQDSIGLIGVPSDSLKIIPKVQKDSIPRIEYRSVYADSIELGNPNFFTKQVLEIKWITEKRDTAIRYKNLMGFNVFYGVYTYGLGFGIFKRLGNDADFIANVNLSYVFDRRTSEDIDTNRNITALIKESRMYPIVFNVGLEKYFMQNRIDWKIKPVLIFGFAPAIVPVVPYELTFFKSLKKLQLSYGIGVFAAVGFDWHMFKTVGVNLTARYSYIPILAGKDIYYYKGFLVNNVGGFYVNFGVTLLQQYFSKN